MVPHFPHMLLSVKNRDNTGTTLSANAAISENGDNTGSTLSANAAVRKDTDMTGTTLSANAAINEKRGHNAAFSEKRKQYTGSTLSHDVSRLQDCRTT